MENLWVEVEILQHAERNAKNTQAERVISRKLENFPDKILASREEYREVKAA